MKRFFIYAIIILAVLFGLNIFALFMYKKSLDIVISVIKSKLDEQGTIIEFSEPEFKSYIGWEPAFAIENVTLKRGDKKDRSYFVFHELYIKFQTFDRMMQIKLKKDIDIKEITNNQERNFIGIFEDGAYLDVKFSDSIDLFLRNITDNLLAKVHNLSFKNEKFQTYEINDGRIEIFTAINNFFLIENDKGIYENGHYKLLVHGGMGEAFYNQNSDDFYVKMLAKFGKSSGSFKLSYTYHAGANNKTTEQLDIEDISSVNKIFALKINGKGIRHQDQNMIEWNLDVNATNYKEVIKAYFDILNYSIAIASKENVIFANSDQVDKVIAIFTNLPEAKITNHDINFAIKKSASSDFKVGGADINVISQKVSNIFTGSF